MVKVLVVVEERISLRRLHSYGDFALFEVVVWG
jgi:hypothetical protein